MTKAKAKTETVTGKFPVTTYDKDGKPVAPGVENTIPAKVAQQIEDIHGKYEGGSVSGAAPAFDAKSPEAKAAIAAAETAAVETHVATIGKLTELAKEVVNAHEAIAAAEKPEDVDAAGVLLDTAIGNLKTEAEAATPAA